MKKSLLYIVISIALIIVVASILSGYHKSKTIKQLEKTVTTKNDSIKVLLGKINDTRIPFKFYYIRPEILFDDSLVKVNDTLQASGFLCAAGMTNDQGVKTTMVYQVIPEPKIQYLVDVFSDSALISKNFFSPDLPIDSGVYGNSEYLFHFVPSTPGKYYIRGYFNIPSIDYYNKLHVSKYPFQKTFEAH